MLKFPRPGGGRTPGVEGQATPQIPPHVGPELQARPWPVAPSTSSLRTLLALLGGVEGLPGPGSWKDPGWQQDGSPSSDRTPGVTWSPAGLGMTAKERVRWLGLRAHTLPPN